VSEQKWVKRERRWWVLETCGGAGGKVQL